MIIGISGKKRSGKDLVGRIIQYLTMKKLNPENKQSFDEFCKYYEADSINRQLRPHRETILGYNYWKIVKFADKLKDIICLLIGCTREQLEDETFKNSKLGEEWIIWTINWVDKLGFGHEEIFVEKEEWNKRIIELEKTTSDIFISQEKRLSPRYLLQFIGTDLLRNQLHPNTWVNATMSDYKDGKPIVFDDPNVVFMGLKAKSITTEGIESKWIITDVRFPNEVQAIKEKNGIVIRINRSNLESNDNHQSEIALDNYNEFNYIIENDGSIEELIEKVKQILIKEKII